MSEKPEDKEKKEICRRDFVKQCASGVVALPFVLAIPSNAPNVITGNDSLLPFKEREEAFHKTLGDKLAQMGRPIPAPPKPLPPPPKPLPKERIAYNTTYPTSKQTTEATATKSGNPPTADDTSSDTYYDGTKEDWKTDYR